VRSLTGEFSAAVRGLAGDLAELRILVEAMLDFPEEGIDHLSDGDVLPRLERLRNALGGLQARARQGSLLRAGLTVVLAGVPNVGKSSLLNRLAGDERAIVTDVPGTTRDALRETIQIEGIPLHIIDTAGLRDTEDHVERVGVERSWREIGRADVIVHIVDARAGVTPADRAVAARLPAGAERIVVENKCDLARQPAARFDLQGHVHLRVSAKTGEGMDLVHSELLRVAGWQSGHGESVILARQRHLDALAETGLRLDEAATQVARLELVAEELRLAQDALSGITGKFSADELLGEIFGRFCIGK
jgi:tRNA modification GTPase